MKNMLEEKGRQHCPTPNQHHSVFSRFRPFEGAVPSEFWVEYTGAHFRNVFENRPPAHRPDEAYCAAPPPFNEEYIEWVALLAAVDHARSPFTMVELGAGMGHWLINGAVGARQQNKSIRLVGVEAEPTHFAFMKQAFADNNIPVEEHQLLQAAVGAEHGESWFSCGNAEQWYGQSLVDETFVQNILDCQSKNRDVGIDYEFVRVPILPLQSILEDLDHVHLLDMDVQGAEADVVEAATNVLDDKVGMVFIGTHGSEVEVRLRRAFTALHWINVFDFPCFSGENDTPHGALNFPDDGAQCWVNPRSAEIVPLLLDGKDSEWHACRHRNMARNFHAIVEQWSDTKKELQNKEVELTEMQGRLNACDGERLHLLGRCKTLEKTFEGVGPRLAHLIRKAKKVKRFFPSFRRKNRTNAHAG